MTKLRNFFPPGTYERHLEFSWILQRARLGYLHNFQNWNSSKLVLFIWNYLNWSELGITKLGLLQSWNFSKLVLFNWNYHLRIRYNITRFWILIHPAAYVKHLEFSWILQRACLGYLHNLQNWNFSKLVLFNWNYHLKRIRQYEIRTFSKLRFL